MNTKVAEEFKALVAEVDQTLNTREGQEPIIIQIGSATCEQAAGSGAVLDEFRKHVAASGRSDIVLHQTGCTGRCSREPIVGVFVSGQMPVKYEQVDREMVHEIFTRHVLGGSPLLEHVLDGPASRVYPHELLVCASARCGWKGREICKAILPAQLEAAGIATDQVKVTAASCFGACGTGQEGSCSHVLVRPENVLYRIRSKEDIEELVDRHIKQGEVVEHLQVEEAPVSQQFFDVYGDVAFFNRQSRVALRNNGVIDPEGFEEYVRFRGFEALAKVLERGDPNWVVEEVTSAKLRGRGGGGFSTGQKWGMAAEAAEKTRYIICNADEGDPGAFMDRSMLESDPLNVLEGMIIGGYAIGASHGYFYVRAEYPMAVRRIENAIEQCRQHGLLGENILGSGFDFDVEIRLGAGAFVCGEETALIHSIEGQRGQPRIRPPYPTESGLWGKPTVINNVETFANIPVVVNFGAEWFSRIGTTQSGGTKVFALSGKVEHTGLVEVPMGTTLHEIVFEIGGGVPGGRKLKAIQTGGPAGGCIPAEMIDLRVDFDSLTKAGSIMGSGGMIVLDEDDCMVDIAKFFITFSQDESCGKCTPCREGTVRMLEILQRITEGTGTLADIDKLERLAWLVKRASLCGLGRAAPNPVLSTLTHYRDEYVAHVTDRKCPAKKCVALIRYEIIEEKCVGCTVCARNCPVDCIAGERRQAHVIDQARCVKCGKCYEICRFDAIERL